jgi:hypothetical protein
LALALNGDIIMVGSVSGASEDIYYFAVARLRPSGHLDWSFGWHGLAIQSFSQRAFASAVAVQPDGKIVAVGVASGVPAVVVRYRRT